MRGRLHRMADARADARERRITAGRDALGTRAADGECLPVTRDPMSR
jgi:hypothetical protein